MIEYLLKVLSVIALSAVKYVGGFALALFEFRNNIYETMIYNIAGGMIGVVIYLYLWQFIINIYRKWFPAKPINGIKMNKRRRIIVKIVKRYELWGIVFFTPIILTVPVGTIVAALIEKNKWKIKYMMLVSFTCWTFVMLIIYLIVGDQLKNIIP